MPKSLRIYRPNKTNNGFASEWQLSFKEANKYDPWLLFLSVSKQTGTDANGNAQFDWENSIKAKLGENDIGEIIATFDGYQDKAGYNGSLFHETPGGGNKIINLARNEKGGFYFKISAQTVDKQSIGPFSHSISIGESRVLSELLRSAIRRIYDW